MAEKFEVSLELPDGIDHNEVRPFIPLIASNLLLASETMKLRFLEEKGSYSQEEVYALLFENWSSWMDIVSRAFKVD